jgi:hypothetical protein
VPYISDAKHERARWMTRKEAVAHVMEHDGCDRRSAWKQLCAAIDDRAIAVKWEDEKPSQPSLSGFLIFPDRPLENRLTWRDNDGAEHVWDWQLVRFRGTKVFDPFTRRDRVLLLSRFAVQQIWSKESSAHPLLSLIGVEPAWPEQSSARPLSPEGPPKIGRPRKLRDKVRDLLLDHNIDLTMPKKKIVQYVRDHWSEPNGPHHNTIVRAVEAAKQSKTRD